MNDSTMHGSLNWAIRDSFLRYVSVIARGTVDYNGVTNLDDGTVVFPLRQAAREADGWHLSFGGSVRFTAHGGYLDVLIAAPEVIIGPDGGVFVTHTEDEQTPLQALVEIVPAMPEQFADGYRWADLQTTLVASAEGHFGNVYAGGTDMAPLTIEMHSIDRVVHSLEGNSAASR